MQPHTARGKSALDVGCGAGLLTEPLARLGAGVTGIDASPEVIAVAREHAGRMAFRSIIARVTSTSSTASSTSSPRWRSSSMSPTPRHS